MGLQWIIKRRHFASDHFSEQFAVHFNDARFAKVETTLGITLKLG
jgi:hypothetical protein